MSELCVLTCIEKHVFSLLPGLSVNTSLCPFSNPLDYVKGFGGKFGVLTDRQDKCALGRDHQEKLQLHESQKGTFILNLLLGIVSRVYFPSQVRHCAVFLPCLCSSGVVSSVWEVVVALP